MRFIKAQRIKWLGHIQRMDQARPTRKLLDWKPIGTRPIGRPRQRWQGDVMEDLKKLKVKNWKETATDRRICRDLAEKAKPHKGLYCQMIDWLIDILTFTFLERKLEWERFCINHWITGWVVTWGDLFRLCRESTHGPPVIFTSRLSKDFTFLVHGTKWWGDEIICSFSFIYANLRRVHTLIFQMLKRYKRFTYSLSKQNEIPRKGKQNTRCTYNVTMTRFRESLSPWKSDEDYISVCVGACLCVRACMWVRGRVSCACIEVHVAVVTQHVTRMRPIVTSFVAPQSELYFSTLSPNRCHFRETGIEHKMCVLIFSTTLSKTFPILRIISRDIVKNVETSSCKVPVILVGF